MVVGGVLATPPADTRVSRFSKDGSLFAWANIDAVFVVRAETGEGLHQLALNRAADLYFSPCNSFLATWQRPEHGTKGENLGVWDLRSGQRVAAFAQRSQTHWWPQWSDDEAVCVRLNTNAVHVYDGRDFGAGIKATLQLERVADVELAPGPAPHKMAVFVPEKNVRIDSVIANRPLTRRRRGLPPMSAST